MSMETIIELPPTLAKDLIISVLHQIPPYTGVDEIIIYENRAVLRGNDPINGLKEALKIIAYSVKRRGENRIPLSGNDKNIIQRIYKCYGIAEINNLYDQIKTFSDHLTNECKEDKLPSLLKPELYEYNRIPGYKGEGKRKMEDYYPAISIMLGLIGYLGSKVGRIRGEQSVLLLPEEVWSINPIESSKFSSALGQFLDQMSKFRYIFPNIHPEPALILWLAINTESLNRFRLFIINDPRGQEPATLSSQLTIDLSRIKEILYKYEILTDYDLVSKLNNILRNVLFSDKPKHSALRFSVLLYETLVGVKSWEETLYFGLRDYMTNLLQEKEEELTNDIGFVSEKLIKKIRET